MREICLDTETTGLDPKDGHRIIEIGCIEIIGKVRTGKSFHVYINPEREVPEEAVKIHGITGEFLKDKPKFLEVVKDFLAFIADSKLVIHNAGFDMKFINHHLRGCNLEIIERGNVVDTLEIARNKFPGAGNSLDALCKRFSIDASRRVKHGALLDAELLADIYIELMGGNQISMFDIGFEAKKTIQKDDKISTDSSSYPERKFPLNEEEIKAHKDFILKNFKENLWEY
ncbi:MAG: polymerase epsilon subunit [Rickettsiaceae bacterium]|jgi:DNA polymerase-3 subunit epsilon|nr:polymerase epsilon subunit [Rickettsiaceae bacterium]